VAVAISVAGNSINRGHPFVAQQVGEMVGLRAAAHEVQRLYEALFVRFPDVQAKRAARTRFLKAQEEVTVQVEFLAAAFKGLDGLVKSWAEVEGAEDSHAAGDALSFAGSPKVINQKVEKITAFLADTATCLRKLQDKKKK
jgi:hypothetical protein